MENRPFGILPLSEGWEQIYKMGVLPLQHSVEGTGSELWGANKFIMVYDLVFKMCIQRDPYNYSEQIYHNYCRAVETYVAMGEEQLRRAAATSNEEFLSEFYVRWSRFLTYINRMTKVFGYLDRFYTPNSMVRSTFREGTHQFGTRVLSSFLDTVLDACSATFMSKNSSDTDPVRFGLAALIDACSLCSLQPVTSQKISSALRRMWSTKTSRELLSILPNYLKSGIIDIIVEYTCPSCFHKHEELFPSTVQSTLKPRRSRWVNMRRSQTNQANQVNQQTNHVKPDVVDLTEDGGDSSSNCWTSRLQRRVVVENRRELQENQETGQDQQEMIHSAIGSDHSETPFRRGSERAVDTAAERGRNLRKLLRDSFLSVFGHEHLEWDTDEGDVKSFGRSQEDGLLVPHARELNTLRRMGFKDRKRNAAALRCTWGNLNEAINILSNPTASVGSQRFVRRRRRSHFTDPMLTRNKPSKGSGETRDCLSKNSKNVAIPTMGKINRELP